MKVINGALIDDSVLLIFPTKYKLYFSINRYILALAKEAVELSIFVKQNVSFNIVDNSRYSVYIYMCIYIYMF